MWCCQALSLLACPEKKRNKKKQKDSFSITPCEGRKEGRKEGPSF
jgi:hypothetical protein